MTASRPPADETSTRATPARARLGVSLMFFTNGVLYSALLPRYPEIKDAFGLSNTGFGLVVVAFPLGAIVAATLAGPAIRRYGAARVTAGGTIALAVALAGAGASPAVWLLALLLFVGGSLDAVVDAAQNVHGLAVERWRGRSIINSLHAVWSIGAATGGVIGATAGALDVPIALQMAVNGVVWSVVAVVSSRLAAIPGSVRAEDAARPREAVHVGSGRAWRLLAPLVLIAICGTLVEDVANNWVVLYLGTEAGAPAALAGLGLTTVLVFQFGGRLLGDPMTDRWGRDRVAGLGGLLIAAGMVVVLLAPHYLLAFAGFGLAGLGCATLVPAAFAAADQVPGLGEGTGVAVLGWLMRLGFLLTSPAIGVIADASSLRTAMVVPLAAGVVAALMAQLSRRRARRPATA